MSFSSYLTVNNLYKDMLEENTKLYPSVPYEALAIDLREMLRKTLLILSVYHPEALSMVCKNLNINEVNHENV